MQACRLLRGASGGRRHWPVHRQRAHGAQIPPRLAFAFSHARTRFRPHARRRLEISPRHESLGQRRAGAGGGLMPEWLQHSFKTPTPVLIEALIGRLLAAAVLGCIIALLYYLSQRREASNSSFVTTLVLLTILIAMVTQIIGDS